MKCTEPYETLYSEDHRPSRGLRRRLERIQSKYWDNLVDVGWQG